MSATVARPLDRAEIKSRIHAFLRSKNVGDRFELQELVRFILPHLSKSEVRETADWIADHQERSESIENDHWSRSAFLAVFFKQVPSRTIRWLARVPGIRDFLERRFRPPFDRILTAQGLGESFTVREFVNAFYPTLNEDVRTVAALKLHKDLPPRSVISREKHS